MFDVGANRGDATAAGLALGYRVVAIEPGQIAKELIRNFIYDNVTILKFAVSDKDFEQVEFYECVEDGLSTINKDWLTDETMPYCGKEFRTTSCTTITLDTLVKLYGVPSLTKIDVEGGEWSVFRGMSGYYGKLTFEWSWATINQHQDQIKYLADLGYTKIAPQFIEHHLQEPDIWYPIEGFDLSTWVSDNSDAWVNGGWQKSNLRPTADVGMLWLS